MLEGVMDGLLSYSMKKGCDDVVLNGYRENRWLIRFSNGNLDVTRFHDESRIDIYLGIRKRRLFTTLNNVDEDVAKRWVDEVSASIDYIPPSPLYVNLPKESYVYPVVPDTFIEDISLDDVVDRLKGLIDLGKSLRLRDISGSLLIRQRKHIIYTSTGNRGEYRRTNLNLNMRFFRGKNISFSVNRVSTGLDALNVEDDIRRYAEWVKGFTKVSKVEPGKYNIIVSPVVAGNLFNYLGFLLSGYSIMMHNSPFVDKLGEKVLDESISLEDNPLLPGNPGYAPFDMEGVPTRDVLLVDNGVIKSYLHNLVTANKFGVDSTGHAGFITPLPHSLILEPKSGSDIDSLLRDVGAGILISNVWYTRFQNYAEGDFSTLQRDVAFLFKDGEFSRVLSGIRVSDNIVRLFSNVIGLGDKSGWVRWWDYRIPCKMPYMAFSDVMVTTGL
jgi:PmbA protein